MVRPIPALEPAQVHATDPSRQRARPPSRCLPCPEYAASSTPSRERTTCSSRSLRLGPQPGARAGRISLGVVRVYIKAMGGWLSFSFLAAGLISTEAARVAGTVWLSYWTNSTHAEGQAPHGAFWYLGVYAAISGVQAGLHRALARSAAQLADCVQDTLSSCGLPRVTASQHAPSHQAAVQVLTMLCTTFLFKALSIKAARGLHNSMLARLLRWASQRLQRCRQQRVLVVCTPCGHPLQLLHLTVSQHI